MGACSDPSKIMKGKMMPGHMGAEQVTVQNLDVVKVDAELNLIAVCGAVPGLKGGIVVLKNTVKNNKVAKGEAGISKNPQKASRKKVREGGANHAYSSSFDMTGKKTGEMELNAAVFGIEPNMTVVHAAVKNYLANQRQGTQSTLTRAEVRGGGIKPWRQKGTGRARQGSIRSPQWTHGGIALGPKPRSYNYSLTKKTKRLAMLSALSAKAAAGEIIVIDGLDMGEIKTKSFVGFLNAVEATGKSLVVTPEVRTNVVKSAANIPGVRTTIASTLNVYDIPQC